MLEITNWPLSFVGKPHFNRPYHGDGEQLMIFVKDGEISVRIENGWYREFDVWGHQVVEPHKRLPDGRVLTGHSVYHHPECPSAKRGWGTECHELCVWDPHYAPALRLESLEYVRDL